MNIHFIQRASGTAYEGKFLSLNEPNFQLFSQVCLYKAKRKQSVPYNFVAGDKPGISLEFQPTKTPVSSRNEETIL